MAYFSVIIPLYNKAPYIKKAIESVFSQSFDDWELVVIDDGSVDESLDVANKAVDGSQYAGRCRVISQANSGVGAARNNGVAVSSGQYVCFLDADDWWDKDFLSGMHQLIEKYPDAGIYGTSYYIVKNGKNRIAPIALDEGFSDGYIDYCEVYSRYLCMPLTSISVAIPRPVFDAEEGFKTNVKLGEDFLLWVKIALKHKVAFFNRQLAYYNQDVNLKNRATRHLHKPEENMLWNLGDLDGFEKTNLSYKMLVDKLRVSGLFGYFLSSRYYDAAKMELDKVDWTKQPKNAVLMYRRPRTVSKVILKTKRLASRIKQLVIHLI